MIVAIYTQSESGTPMNEVAETPTGGTVFISSFRNSLLSKVSPPTQIKARSHFDLGQFSFVHLPSCSFAPQIKQRLIIDYRLPFGLIFLFERLVLRLHFSGKIFMCIAIGFRFSSNIHPTVRMMLKYHSIDNLLY